MTQTVKVKKLHPDAVIPFYATKGSACFDLVATSVEYSVKYQRDITITCGTGLSFEIPEGYAMMIYSRSGHGFKYDTRLSNCVGVIDSDYRGEVKVKLTVDSNGPAIEFEKGDKVAQAMVIAVPHTVFEETDCLSTTERGTQGFGSTGM